MMRAMLWTQLIRELREAGLTQEDIAASIGVSQPSVSDLANGKTKNPSFEVGDKLRALHKRISRKALAKAA